MYFRPNDNVNRGDRGTTVFKPSVLTVMTESRSNGLKVGNSMKVGDSIALDKGPYE